MEEVEDILKKDKKINLSGEEQQMKRKHVRKHEEPGRVILGLKLSQGGLQFFFKGRSEAVERWMFRSILLDDNQWHTLILVIHRHHIRLTVDCKPPLEM